uniref:Fatty-acid and retinol-binding protein 6 n=1 Tax=Aphelenchoides besseyi TaxID=269767 RepID=A0A1S5RMF6_9BILA|nr:fatty-acid and retinol-binding protein 6 [Aphelenchoides besseyi]
MWTSMVMEVFTTVLLLLLLPLSRATQISDVPETFHGLISNGIKEFYATLTDEERVIVDLVDANNTEPTYAAGYRIYNKELGDRADDFLNNEALRILQLDAPARNFYLNILQIPDKLKAIAEDEEQQKFVAQRLIHEFDKLTDESQNKLQEQFPEVYETLVGITFRRFAGASLESKQEDREKLFD